MSFKRKNENLKHVREGKGFCHESTVKAHGKTYHVRFHDVHPRRSSQSANSRTIGFSRQENPQTTGRTFQSATR